MTTQEELERLPRHEWTPVTAIESEIHAQVWGDRVRRATTAPLILVAGTGVSSRYWKPLARRLGEVFQVFAPDLPGFGRSPKPRNRRGPAGPSAREQADQLIAWMDARHIDQVVLCGHSTGCQVVADVATRLPDRVSKLILAAPPTTPERPLVSHLLRLMTGALFERPMLHLLLNVEYGSAGPLRVLQQGVKMASVDLESKLSRIDVPTLVLRGAFDPLCDRRWASVVVGRLPRGRLVEIERAGHAIHFTAPKVTAQVIEDFISRPCECSKLHKGQVVAPKDSGRGDRFRAPQPISPLLHAAIDGLAAAAAVVIPRKIGWSSRTQKVLDAAAGASVLNNVICDHGLGAGRKLPMVTHVNNDIASGITLLVLSQTHLRREPRLSRLAVAGLGLFQIASAALTAKPTGPARYRGTM